MFLKAATSVTKLIMNFSPYYKPPTVRILDTSSTLKATSMLNMNSPLVPTIRPFEIGVSSIRRCLSFSLIYQILAKLYVFVLIGWLGHYRS